MAPIHVAVLGYGFSANAFHIPYIVRLFELRTILDREVTPQRNPAKAKYGPLGVKVVTTLDEVINDPEIDLVVVAVRDMAHVPFTTAVLKAGKHVILEKPITATSAEARALIALAKEKHLILAPYLNRRFDGDFRTLKSLIDAGKVSFLSRYDIRGDWPMDPPGGSSGMIYGLGTHLIDQAIALYGEPKTVTGFLMNGRREPRDPPEVDDSCIVHLTYANNPVVVTVRCCLHSVASHQIRYIARSKNSSYVKYGLDPQESQVMFQGLTPLSPGFGEEPEEKRGEFGIQVDGKDTFIKVKTLPGCYLDYYKNVASAINGTGSLIATPEQAELGIRIIEAAKLSDKEKRTVDFATFGLCDLQGIKLRLANAYGL
ncbi:NADP-binding protein [Dacryopinax primogenitus]|uniref:NADP-binding protein n=1 Tax=Dacryopinax primogenitus (strain DJM 731) TaxID=1858805 RepID=M5GDP2_DACPD|nr:NADP-binding protein [Dacryopinax primogenitus]EJU04682.1 NADP-binding protein [Dacryopinax primogenitus]